MQKTFKSERAAQIELGKLLEQAAAGRQPGSAVTVAQLLGWLAIDPVTCALIAGYLAEIKAELAAVGVGLCDDAYLLSGRLP